MGRMKDLLTERIEESADERLARKLGLTYDELVELNHSITTEESPDGLIYNYIISFDENACKEILASYLCEALAFVEAPVLPNDLSQPQQFQFLLRAQTAEFHFASEIHQIHFLQMVQSLGLLHRQF